MPGVEAYTSVINGLAQGGNVDEVFEILNLMVNRTIQPNVFTSTSIMNACIRQKMFSKAKSLLKNYNQYFPGLSRKDLSVLYGSYVGGLCRMHSEYELKYLDNGGGTNDAKYRYLLEAQLGLIYMAKHDLSPDITTINAVIQSLCLMSPPRISLALIIMKFLPSLMIRADDYTFAIIFTALGKVGYSELALSMFLGISKEMDLDTAAVNSLLNSLANGRNPSTAIKVYKELMENNRTNDYSDLQYVPDVVTFTTVFLAMSRLKNQLISSNHGDLPSESNRFATFVNNEKMSTIKNNVANALQELDLNITPSPFMSMLKQIGVLNPDPLKVIDRQGNVVYDDREGRLYEYDGKSSSSAACDITDNFNELLHKLYSKMRFELRIKPDIYLAKTINALFSKPSALYFNGGESALSISQETARLIFEDLILNDIHPLQVSNLAGQ